METKNSVFECLLQSDIYVKLEQAKKITQLIEMNIYSYDENANSNNFNNYLDLQHFNWLQILKCMLPCIALPYSLVILECSLYCILNINVFNLEFLKILKIWIPDRYQRLISVNRTLHFKNLSHVSIKRFSGPIISQICINLEFSTERLKFETVEILAENINLSNINFLNPIKSLIVDSSISLSFVNSNYKIDNITIYIERPNSLPLSSACFFSVQYKNYSFKSISIILKNPIMEKPIEFYYKMLRDIVVNSKPSIMLRLNFRTEFSKTKVTPSEFLNNILEITMNHFNVIQFKFTCGIFFDNIKEENLNSKFYFTKEKIVKNDPKSKKFWFQETKYKISFLKSQKSE